MDKTWETEILKQLADKYNTVFLKICPAYQYHNQLQYL